MAYSFLDGLWDGTNSAFYNESSRAPASTNIPRQLPQNIPQARPVMPGPNAHPNPMMTRQQAQPMQMQAMGPTGMPPMHPSQHQPTQRENEQELRHMLDGAVAEIQKRDQTIAAYAMTQKNSGENYRKHFRSLEIVIYILLAITVIMAIILIVICQKMNTMVNMMNQIKL